ncbi:MAG: hypothetical protein ACOH2V_12210 [Candidatus Saccharimonadaceae bacterium]
MFSSAQYIKEKATPLEGDASLNRLIFMTADKKDEGNIKRRGYKIVLGYTPLED